MDELALFYQEVLGLRTIETPQSQDAEMMKFRWLRLGDRELHVVEKNSRYAALEQLPIDPSRVPHFALRLEPDAFEAVKRKLDAKRAPWMDWSTRGIAGLNQLFFEDPERNLVELEGW